MSNRFLRWSMYLLVACLFAAACVYLSQWQFDRSEQRNTQLALVAANYDAEPVPLNELIGASGVFDFEDEWRPVIVRGEYAIDDTLLVRNRPHGGTRAFEVVVPLHTDDGRIFIVNRGWVLASGPDDLPEMVPAPVSGLVEVVVRLKPGEALPQSGRSAPAGQVPTIHLPSIAAVAGATTVTSAYGQIVSESPAAETRLGWFLPPTEDPGPHLSYAIQWILFGVMGFVFIGYIIRTEIVRKREDDEGIEPKRRRRDRDAEDEDAILDA